MRLGGAINGIELKPFHLTYQDISSAFHSENRLQAYNCAFIKYRDLESGDGESEVVLESLFDIIIALTLSADGFLPSKVQKLLSLKTLMLIREAQDKNLTLLNFDIKPPKRGRKKDSFLKALMISGVINKMNQGHKKTHAYELVAEELHRSPETVRRVMQRWEKEELAKLPKIT